MAKPLTSTIQQTAASLAASELDTRSFTTGCRHFLEFVPVFMSARRATAY